VANFVYGKAKQGILNGQFNFSLDTFKIAFVKNTYTPNQSVHEFLSDIGASNISYTSPIIENITNTLGIIDADDLNFSLPANTAFNSIVFYKLGANDSSSRLLFYIDTSEGIPFPGSSEVVTLIFNWSNTVNKILAI
jgi:hypothetical protein